MKNTMEVGQRLVELCQKGELMEAIETLYDKEIVSVEPVAMQGMPAEMKGLQAVTGKSQWWIENHTVHGSEAVGPFPHGDRFAVLFRFDITNKPSGHRMKMDEVALYTVKDGKIVREEFFYAPGPA